MSAAVMPDDTAAGRLEHAQTSTLTAPPTIGAEWPGLPGSFYAGVARADGDQPDGHLVLLADKSASALKWAAAKTWAEGLGDGARLPTRFESALLFANARDQFEPEWHWTGTDYEGDGSYAWFHYFGHGNQNNNHKSYEGRARAVRRFPVGPSIL